MSSFAPHLTAKAIYPRTKGVGDKAQGCCAQIVPRPCRFARSALCDLTQNV